MTSIARIDANRRNAQLSTGPVTSEGKAAAAQNARRHGLLSKEVVLPDEDQEAFDSLMSTLREEMNPAGEAESQLVERMAACAWRLRRLGRVEAGVFVYQIRCREAELARAEVSRYETDALAVFANAVTDRAKHEEALARVRDAEKRREAAQLGMAYVRDATGPDAFAKLSRYEAAIERSLYRALHELQRLQAIRGGQAVPAPVVVDVEVSSSQE